MQPSLIIGLIGGIGCGKSTALAFFEQQGVNCFSADKIAQQLLQPPSPFFSKVAQHLGHTALNKQGHLNRNYLRHLLISSPEFKSWLESLMHPEIQTQLIQLVQHSSSPYCVLEIPLLKDPKPYGIQRILCIDCHEDLQKQRLQQRCLSENEINGLLAAQIPKALRHQMANDLIENNGDLNEFLQKLTRLHADYLQLAKST